MTTGWDIIIVGAGTAGIPCAITAAERGARVVVLEKSDRIGGTLFLTGGHMSGGGTRRQKTRGIQDNPDLHFQDVLRVSHDTVDHAITRVAVEEAPHTLDWLDELGLPFVEDTPKIIYGHEPYQQPRTAWAVDAGRSILQVWQPKWDEQIAAGRITLLLGHKLTDIVFENGAVVGIKAEHAHGTLELHGKAVVLATGGYASNPKFFAEVTPGAPRVVSSASHHTTGDGIIAAMQLGAKFRDGHKYLATLGGIEPEPGSCFCDWNQTWASVYSPLYRQPREIWVNERGERFVAEDHPSVDHRERAALAQPQQRFWIIFDETALTDGAPLVRPFSIDEFRAKATEGKWAWTAENIIDLAEKAGIDPNGLRLTVEMYNESVKRGDDPLGRAIVSHPLMTTPFYAVLTYAASLITFGGLAIDAELRVLDETGQPIPNLYAAGEIIGAGATSGNAFCSGMVLTPAISFGRILGRRLSSVSL